MRKKWKKALLITHCTGLLLCLVLLFCVRQGDHLRWNLGYAIVWLTTLSGLVVCFFNARRTWVNILLRAYGFLWLCWLVLLPLCTMGMWLAFITEVYIPQTRFYEADGYVMRRSRYDFMKFPETDLLRNSGLVEEHLRTYGGVCTVDSFSVREDIGAVIISGTGYAGGGMRLDDRFTDVFPLDDSTYNAHKKEVELLRKAVRRSEAGGRHAAQ